MPRHARGSANAQIQSDNLLLPITFLCPWHVFQHTNPPHVNRIRLGGYESSKYDI